MSNYDLKRPPPDNQSVPQPKKVKTDRPEDNEEDDPSHTNPSLVAPSLPPAITVNTETTTPETGTVLPANAKSTTAVAISGAGTANAESLPSANLQTANSDDETDEVQAAIVTVQLLLMEAVEELSIVARALERWTVFAPSLGISEELRVKEKERYDDAVKKGKSRIAEHLRRFMRKSRKLSEFVTNVRVFDDANIPVDLIAHVDAFLSPNTWLRALYEEIEYENSVARGELEALGSFHSTFRFYSSVLDRLHEVDLVKVPDFTESALPPTALRAPCKKDDRRVDLTQVLTMLKWPLKPCELGTGLKLRQ